MDVSIGNHQLEIQSVDNVHEKVPRSQLKFWSRNRKGTWILRLFFKNYVVDDRMSPKNEEL